MVCFIDVAMQPKCWNAAKMLQCSQNVTKQPKLSSSVTLWNDSCCETNLLLWVAFNCFVLLPVVWVLTNPAVSAFWVRYCFSGFGEINSFLPLVCYTMTSHMNKQNNNTIIVKQYCPCSFLHNSSRNVSGTHDLLWDSSDNVLRLNLTLTKQSKIV